MAVGGARASPVLAMVMGATASRQHDQRSTQLVVLEPEQAVVLAESAVPARAASTLAIRMAVPLPRAERRVALAPTGSRRADELADDMKAARVAFWWLKRTHATWFDTLSRGTRIARGAALEGAMVAALMLQGSRYLGKARCAVIRYDRWAAGMGDMLPGGGYPGDGPSPMMVSWFIQDATDDYRDTVEVRAERRSDGSKGKFKGTTAEGLVKALAAAHLAFSAPFYPSVLKHPLVALAAVPPPDCEFEVEEEAHMSVYMALTYEDLALDGSMVNGRLVGVAARDWARFFSFLAANGLRTCEGLRMRFKSIRDAIAHYVCAGGKPRKMVKIKPFEDVAPAEGFSGEWPWFEAWVGGLIRKEYAARAFKVPRHGHFLFDAYWDGDHAATPAMVSTAWYALNSAPPLSASSALLRAARGTAYATRHLLQDIVRDQAWPRDQRNELNRWAALPRAVDGPEASASGERRREPSIRRAAVTRYSGGNAALGKRLELRVEGLRLVSSFVKRSGKPWREAVPKELGCSATFSFLRQTTAVAEVGVGGGGDDVPPFLEAAGARDESPAGGGSPAPLMLRAPLPPRAGRAEGAARALEHARARCGPAEAQ